MQGRNIEIRPQAGRSVPGHEHEARCLDHTIILPEATGSESVLPTRSSGLHTRPTILHSLRFVEEQSGNYREDMYESDEKKRTYYRGKERTQYTRACEQGLRFYLRCQRPEDNLIHTQSIGVMFGTPDGNWTFDFSGLLLSLFHVHSFFCCYLFTAIWSFRRGNGEEKQRQCPNEAYLRGFYMVAPDYYYYYYYYYLLTT